MTQVTWQRLRSFFEQAVRLPAAERSTWLRQIRNRDPNLADELQDMLEADEETSLVIGQAVGRVAAAAVRLQEPTQLATAKVDSPELESDRKQACRATTPEAQAPPPLDLGPYRLQRPLGRGGMATVYRARRTDGAYEQIVAIKMLDLQTPQIERRFRLERQILATLNHPNIVRLMDAGESPSGAPYAVLEYVDGQPIHYYCERRRLPIGRRLSLFRTICSAVGHAHRRGIVHRDLKPANILVTSDGTVKVLDFGIAKALEEADLPGAPVYTAPDVQVLTPAYASPEQRTGETVGPASDIYALGLVLFAILSGERPPASQDMSADERARRVRSKLRRANTPGHLIRAVERALAKRPEERFSDVQSLAEATRSADWRKWGWLGAGAALLVVTLGWWVFHRPAGDALSLADLSSVIELSEARISYQAEKTMPVHDMRPAHERLQQAVARVESRFAGSSHWSPETQHQVARQLGQAYSALNRPLDARRRFEDSLAAEVELPIQAPSTQERVPVSCRLAFSLGLAELEIRWKAQAHSRKSDAQSRAEPALQECLSSGPIDAGARAYALGLLSALDGNAEAVRLHAEMAVGSRWQVSALLLAAEALKNRHLGSPVGSGLSSPEADIAPKSAQSGGASGGAVRRAYEKAAQAAPSELRAYLGLCLMPDAAFAEAQDHLLGPAQRLEACLNAVKVRPDHAAAQAQLARLEASGSSRTLPLSRSDKALPVPEGAPPTGPSNP